MASVAYSSCDIYHRRCCLGQLRAKDGYLIMQSVRPLCSLKPKASLVRPKSTRRLESNARLCIKNEFQDNQANVKGYAVILLT